MLISLPLILFFIAGLVPAPMASASALDDGVVAYYSFDSCTAIDVSGNGHDGRVYGEPQCVGGVVGSAMWFDGDDDWIDIGDSDDLRLTSFTITMWFKMDPSDSLYNQGSSWSILLTKGGIGDDCYGDNANYLVGVKNGYLYAGFEREAHQCYGVDNDEFLRIPISALTGWTFLALTYDSSTKALKLYINGELVGYRHTGGDPELNSQPLRIADNSLNYYDKFRGYLDEVRIYNRPLSESEIKTLYLQGNDGEIFYKYVFPLVHLESYWGSSGYESTVWVMALEDTTVYIDEDFNGVDDGDPHFVIHAGEKLRIGDVTGAYANTPVDYSWTKNPLAIYSTAPVATFMVWNDADYGDYEDGGFRYSSPVPGRRLVGANVRWLYVTPYEDEADIYINGQFVGTLRYGEVLVKKFDRPETVVITSSKPVVAAAAYANPTYKSMTHAFSLMPPSTGSVIVPKSIREYAEDRGTQEVSEYYVVVDENGNVIRNETLPSTLEVVTLNDPSAVFVFRTFYYPDPWGNGAPRYAMSATELKPAYEGRCYAYLFPPSIHGVISDVSVYSDGDVKLYLDYDADGTFDETDSVAPEDVYELSTYDLSGSKVSVYSEGPLACSYLLVGGWNGQLEGAYEFTSSYAIPEVLSGQSLPPSQKEVFSKIGDTLLIVNNATGKVEHVIRVLDVSVQDEAALVSVDSDVYTLSEGDRLYGDLSMGFDVKFEGPFVGLGGIVFAKLSIYLVEERDVANAPELTIESTPSGAEVYINGTYEGETPLEVTLLPGEYEIKVSKEGYEERTSVVHLLPGDSVVLNFNLSSTSGTVTIVSEPSGADVYINGDYRGKTPLEVNLPPGTYEIRISKEEYQEKVLSVTIEGSEAKFVSVSLTPEFGFITVVSTPLGAKVYLDGKYVGKTPLDGLKVSVGTHEVLLKKDGYNETKVAVEVTPGKTSRISVTLHEAISLLKVCSDPPEAEVYVNNNFKGITPVTLEVDPGTYEVRIVKADYEEYVTMVKVGEGETKVISAELVPKFGFLSVNSEPSGARVYINGKYIGKTPIEGYRLDTGEYELRLKLEEYQEYSTKVVITPGEVTERSIELVPTYAYISVDSTPSGAEVYLDGVHIGVTPIRKYRVQPGSHELRVALEGYSEYREAVNVEPGDDLEITAELKPEPKSPSGDSGVTGNDTLTVRVVQKSVCGPAVAAVLALLVLLPRKRR